MEKRIKISVEDWKRIYEGKPRHNDYFIAVGTSSGGEKGEQAHLILFDSLKEAEAFNNQMQKTFKTSLNL
jgi:hypothetical protein